MLIVIIKIILDNYISLLSILSILGNENTKVTLPQAIRLLHLNNT